MLFTPPSKIKHYGRQSCLPPDWPFRDLHSWEVWVLPSSSGRAVMTKEERVVPYQQLAKRFHDIPWPMIDLQTVDHKLE
ncbi:unnamed protein product [Albugo candida]|nr:unnamed protein product [Albugo candida]|eukprot:CCI48653.1 unnamed protein product [Albugo candida]